MSVLDALTDFPRAFGRLAPVVVQRPNLPPMTEFRPDDEPIPGRDDLEETCRE